MSVNPPGNITLVDSHASKRPIFKISATKSSLDTLLNNPKNFTINFSKSTLTNGKVISNFKASTLPPTSIIYQLKKGNQGVAVGPQIGVLNLEDFTPVPALKLTNKAQTCGKISNKASVIKVRNQPSSHSESFPINISKKPSIPASISKPPSTIVTTNNSVLPKTKQSLTSQKSLLSDKCQIATIENRSPNGHVSNMLKRTNTDSLKSSKYPKSIKTIQSQISKLDKSSTPSPTPFDLNPQANLSGAFKKYISLYKAIIDKKKKIQYYLELDFNLTNDLDYKLFVQQIKRLTSEKSMLDLQAMTEEYNRLHQIFKSRQIS